MDVRITDSEWKIMEQLWEQKELTQPELMSLLNEGWAKNTVHTFLTRLHKKGLITVESDKKPHKYRPLISREECIRQEEESFLDKVFGGSAGMLVSSFVKSGKLTKEEREELKKLLEAMEND